MQLPGTKSIESGYTLIELLVGISLIGLILSFGYAGFREFSRRQALISARRLIQGELRMAQAKAIDGIRPNGACGGKILEGYSFNLASESRYQILTRCSKTDVLVKDQNLAATGITLTATQNPIFFKALGQGTNIKEGAVAEITLTQTTTGRTLLIFVDAGGQIR